MIHSRQDNDGQRVRSSVAAEEVHSAVQTHLAEDLASPSSGNMAGTVLDLSDVAEFERNAESSLQEEEEEF